MSNLNVATSLHKHGIISDDDEKLSAIRRPKVTSAHIDRAMNDKYRDVRETVMKIKKERNL